MSVARLMNRPCTIVHKAQTGPVDAYGDPTWVDTATATVCFAEQRTSTENTALEDIQSQDWMIVVPAGTAVAGPDQILLDDPTAGALTLEVIGPPSPLFNPRTQAVSHLELDAKQVV